MLNYEWFRSRGFRICSTHCDNRPHMVRIVNHRSDTAIEICEPISPTSREWFVWLRSDLAGTRSRFVFMRDVTQPKQVDSLWLGLTDCMLVQEPYDAEQFAQAIKREREDCERRYVEYAKQNLRYGYVPGG